MERALQFSSRFSVNNRVSCTQNRTRSGASRATTLRSAFTGTTNSASLSSKDTSTREIWSWVKSKTVGHGRYRRSQVRAEMFGQSTSGLEAAWTKLKG